MTETQAQQECLFCHSQNKERRIKYGKTIWEQTDWYDWRHRKQRKHVEAKIISPENKHPRLRSTIVFRETREPVLNMSIKYCPRCGRKLGEGND